MKPWGALGDLLFSALAGTVSYGAYHLTQSILVAALLLTAFALGFLWIHSRRGSD